MRTTYRRHAVLRRPPRRRSPMETCLLLPARPTGVRVIDARAIDLRTPDPPTSETLERVHPASAWASNVAARR